MGIGVLVQNRFCNCKFLLYSKLDHPFRSYRGPPCHHQTREKRARSVLPECCRSTCVPSVRPPSSLLDSAWIMRRAPAVKGGPYMARGKSPLATFPFKTWVFVPLSRSLDHVLKERGRKHPLSSFDPVQGTPSSRGPSSQNK